MTFTGLILEFLLNGRIRLYLILNIIHSKNIHFIFKKQNKYAIILQIQF